MAQIFDPAGYPLVEFLQCLLASQSGFHFPFYGVPDLLVQGDQLAYLAVDAALHRELVPSSPGDGFYGAD